MSTLHEDGFTFMTISRRILRMRNVSNRSCSVYENTHFMFNKFLPKNCAVYETMLKNMVAPEEPQIMTKYGAYELYAG
jgi:hypothetical protein